MSIEWRSMKDGAFPLTVADQWTMVVDYLSAPALMKIETAGAWPIGSVLCGPDGDSRIPALPSPPPPPFGATPGIPVTIPAPTPAPTYPVGTLLGKIGGSTAGRDGAKVFAIGRCCIVEVPQEQGPLFVAAYADPKTLASNAYFVHVIVSVARR